MPIELRDVPLFGDSINSYSPAVSRQRRLNCFYDIRQDGDKAQMIIRGTPGAVLFKQLPTSPIRGWTTVKNVFYVVAGPVFYSVQTDGTYAVLGVMTVSTSKCRVQDNGLQIIIVDGTQAWGYTLVNGSYSQAALNAAGSFAKLTDASFPNGAKSDAFLNGRIISESPDTRTAYVSELYDLTKWTNFTGLPTTCVKENSSDNLLAVDVLNGAIVFWGAQSIEFWQDVANSPNPFQRINGASQTWGLAAVESRVALNNTMVFLGQNPQGGVQVMKLNGYTPARISNSDIENLIASFSTKSDATALTYIVDGHTMYQLNFPTAARSFLYDDTTGLWGEVQTGLAIQARHFANLGIAFNTLNFVADSTTGNIYQLRTDVFTDNGMSIKRQAVSRHIHGGGNEVKVSILQIDMETGVGNESGAGSDPQIVLQVSKDNGRTFGIERPVSFGKVGQYRAPRAIWRRLGSSKDFVFMFTMTDPVKFTLTQGRINPPTQQ